MKKNKRRKLNKKRFLGLLAFLGLIGIFITYLLNLKVSNVLIIGNSNVGDSTIMTLTNLRSHPKFTEINKKTLEEQILNIPLIDKVKINKYLDGTIKLTITEEEPLIYLEDTSKIITDKGNIYENISLKKETMPTLKTNLEPEILNLLIKALKKIDSNILNMISEIEYSKTINKEGKIIDDKRFTFYMNDGNIAYINTINIAKFNNYLKAVSKTIDTYGAGITGIFSFDSGTNNIVFQKKDSDLFERES